MNIEEVFSSRLRMKIVRILAQLGELNVSEIARKLGANYETTAKHLRILEDAEILRHKMFGRIRLYRLDEHSARSKAVQNLLDVWEQANKQSLR